MVDLACHLTEKVWPSALVKSATSIWVPIDLHLVVNWQAIVPLQIHFHVVLDPWYWWCKEMLQHVSDLPIQLFSKHFNRLLSYESYTIHDYPMNPGRISLFGSKSLEIYLRIQLGAPENLSRDPTSCRMPQHHTPNATEFLKLRLHNLHIEMPERNISARHSDVSLTMSSVPQGWSQSRDDFQSQRWSE